jgi:hypothetical protein
MTQQNKFVLDSYEPLECAPGLIKESREQNGGKIVLKGILQRADVLNQNGRIYPKTILEREIRNYQKFIVENRSLGELDHPSDSVVNLKNVSHIIRSAEMDGGGTVRGALELLDTPSGKIAQQLVESGVKLGVSSRGVGSTKQDGNYHVVQEDYILICFDIVNDPSTSSAFVLPEGVQISVKKMNDILTRSDRVDRVLNDLLFYRKI